MSTPISQEEAAKLLKEIIQWQIDESGTTIAKTFTFDDFQDAIVFVNQVARIAEESNHHPDIFIHSYSNVTVSLTTHAVNGLTEQDFLVAAKVDEVTS